MKYLRLYEEYDAATMVGHDKTVYLVHGWDGEPDGHWFPWLRHELEDRGFVVVNPSMPDPETPDIEAWVDCLKEVVIDPHINNYFVGHSIGCQAIMRYLETLADAEVEVGGVVFVAGFFDLPNLETDEEVEVADPWLNTPIDCEAVKVVSPKVTTILSDDDEDVDFEQSKEDFIEYLDSKIIEEEGMGHFTLDDGVEELPSVLNTLLDYVT